MSKNSLVAATFCLLFPHAIFSTEGPPLTITAISTPPNVTQHGTEFVFSFSGSGSATFSITKDCGGDSGSVGIDEHTHDGATTGYNPETKTSITVIGAGSHTFVLQTTEEADEEDCIGWGWNIAMTGTTTARTICLKEVTYAGDVDVFQDNGTKYTGIDWLDNNGDCAAFNSGERRFPICYVKNSAITVSKIVFKVCPKIQNTNGVKIKAEGFGINHTADIPEGGVSISTSAGCSLVKWTSDHSAAPSLPNNLAFHNDWIFYWQVKINGTWATAGFNDNRIYVIDNSSQNVTRRESLLDIGLRSINSGPKTLNGAVSSMWTYDFEGPVPGVERKALLLFEWVPDASLGRQT